MRAATIWIDLDNAPHAHFFAPIVRDLRMRGQKLVITVRAFGQTEPLARSYGMECTSIGMHATDLTSAGRAAETLTRAARLIPFGMRYRPDVAVSHGSRALTIAAAVLGIPCMALYDYEHVSAGLFHRLCRRVLVPRTVLHQDTRKTIGYPGLKEDVYIHDFVPDADILQRLAIDPGKALVTVRPPATWAHYHNEHSTNLFRALVEHLRQFKDVQVLILARTAEQEAQLYRDFQVHCAPFRVMSEAVDGLSLLYYSDAVFSGGGTMVREAALMGCEAYSTFAGKPGAVDLTLERSGQLKMLRTPDDVRSVRVCRRSRSTQINNQPPTRNFIVQQILDLTQKERIR